MADCIADSPSEFKTSARGLVIAFGFGKKSTRRIDGRWCPDGLGMLAMILFGCTQNATRTRSGAPLSGGSAGLFSPSHPMRYRDTSGTLLSALTLNQLN
jgi:hypothetical protein